MIVQSKIYLKEIRFWKTPSEICISKCI